MKLPSARTLLFGSSVNGNNVLQAAWLLFRFYIGLSLALGAGLPKIQDGIPEWFEKQVFDLGFTWPSSQFWATLAAWAEFVGGLFLAVGLLTRLMALQLAFQFFVISFLWYDSPAPFIGMYYQQLFFWGYVLILAGGGGRFSIDCLLHRRLHVRPAVVRAAVAVVLLSLFLLPACEQRSVRTRTVVFRVHVPGTPPQKVSLRGSDAPLSWERDLLLQPDSTAGYFTTTATFRSRWSFTDLKFVRDGLFELEGKGNRRVSFAVEGDTTFYQATFDSL